MQQTDTEHPLTHLNLLIIDPDKNIAKLLEQVLRHLGFGQVFLAADGQEAIKILHQKPADIILTDWDMEPMNGIDFITAIRKSATLPNRMVPIVMLTAKAQRNNIEQARDAGITEFVVKPFTAKALCDRFMLITEHPRNFVLSPNYVGPDRRRHLEEIEPSERRSNLKGTQRIISQRDNTTTFQVANSQEPITMIAPDFKIKKKIGEHTSIEELLSPEKVAEAQTIIIDSTDQFLTWVRDDIELLEAAFKGISTPDHTEKDIQKLATITLRIKSQAGTFGYSLASSVANLLYKVLSVTHVNDTRKQAIRKHIDAFHVIFHANLTGQNCETSNELMKSLVLLAQKIVKDETTEPPSEYVNL